MVNKYAFNIMLTILIGMLYPSKGYSQPKDTSSLIQQINSSINEQQKLEHLLQLCHVLLDQKSDERLSVFAMDAFRISSKLKDNVAKVEACYFLAKSFYELTEYDQCSYYAKIGLGLAEKNNLQVKGAYFNNTLGLTERRMDNCDSAIEYYNEAIAINEKLKDSIELAKNYRNISICYRIKGDFNKSFESLNKGLLISRKMNDVSAMANAYTSIGHNYRRLNNYDKALENYIHASRYFKDANDTSMVAGRLINIGLVYQYLKDNDAALNYYEQAKQLLWKEKNSSNLGVIYQNIGNVLAKKGDYISAIENEHKALRIFESIERIGSVSDVLLNIGLHFMQAGQLDSAEIYLLKSYEISKENEDSYDYANVNLELGRLHIFTGKYDLSYDYIEKGKSLANSRNDNMLVSYANQYFYELFDKKGDSGEALQYYKLYRSQRDSINIMKQEQAVTRIKAQYDFEKQDAEIELLNKENLLKEAEVTKTANQRNLLFALLGLMTVIVWSISFLFRYSKRKNKIITREKERAEELLLNILPAETANELQKNGFVRAKRFELTTVLFSDFVNFSNYAEAVDPEEVVKSIDFYFCKFDRIIEDHGLEKIKTIGDSYMCAGGLPNPNKSNPIQVIEAAKEIIALVNKTKLSPPKGIHPFDIRIGINSGPVVAGIVGIKKFQYDIWGDTVNIASRMESSSDVGKINISSATYDLIKDKIPCEYKGEAEIKNLGKMKMYHVI